MSRPPRALTEATLEQAARALAERDRELATILTTHGPPPMWGRQPGFVTLIRIILEQQVSLAGARTMYLRLRAHLGAITPQTVHAAGIPGLRDFGLTRQKARYCHALAGAILEEQLDLSAVARAPDHEGRATLLALPGIGPWSVAIYYLMALRRPDIWPEGDLALAVAMQRVKRLNALPDRRAQHAMAEGWAPWRSVAARMLWQEYLGTQAARRLRSA